jgi:hypothetical protein
MYVNLFFIPLSLSFIQIYKVGFNTTSAFLYKTFYIVLTKMKFLKSYFPYDDFVKTTSMSDKICNSRLVNSEMH